MDPRNRFIMFVAAVISILAVLVYGKYFGMDTISTIYIILGIITIFGLVDFFFGWLLKYVLNKVLKKLDKKNSKKKKKQ